MCLNSHDCHKSAENTVKWPLWLHVCFIHKLITWTKSGQQCHEETSAFNSLHLTDQPKTKDLKNSFLPTTLDRKHKEYWAATVPVICVPSKSNRFSVGLWAFWEFSPYTTWLYPYYIWINIEIHAHCNWLLFVCVTWHVWLWFADALVACCWWWACL